MNVKKTLNIAKHYFAGNLRCAEFALTNACVAKCTFCNIWKQKPKIFVDKDKALSAIDRLADLGVSHMCFTGGEALLHPNIVDFVELATKRKINSAILLADPRLLMRKNMIERLEKAGGDLISISFDSEDPETMAKSRGIDNIMDEMNLAMKRIKQTSLKTMASVLIWNGNCEKLAQVCAHAEDMGFDFISLNYPTYSESNTYELGGEGIDFPRDKLIQALESAISLREKGYKIINTAGSMRNIIDYLKDPSSARFHCFGGSHVLFVDWFFDLYPCMQLAKPIGNLFDIEAEDLNMPACNLCNMSWYRDLSAYFYGMRSIPVIWESLTNSGRLL
jgi:MoaA/NifB/PqqE/SkfB family radical SAM enzyme